MEKKAYEVVFCIVNAGYSENVMDSARSVGVGGGTVLRAQGTANKVAESMFNLTIQPEKELVMMLVPKEIKDNVLRVLYEEVGLETLGNGIAFSMPVDGVVGLGRARQQLKKKEKADKAEDTQEHPSDGETEKAEKQETEQVPPQE